MAAKKYRVEKPAVLLRNERLVHFEQRDCDPLARQLDGDTR